KVSTWLGAPFMNRKTTRFALAGKWLGLGESRLDREDAPGCFGTPSAAVALEKNPWRVRTAIRANPAKPPPASQRNYRPVRPHGVRLGMKREGRWGEGIGSRPGAPVSADGRSPESARDARPRINQGRQTHSC